jgi:hypothetical protein
MSTNNHHNSRCGFEELLVSYIYDEIGSSEKSNFEKHLDGCKTCAEEFSSFGRVRSSINDWKNIEFAELETPSISIPELKSKTMVSFAAPKSKRSRFYWIRDLFSLTPNWATAASIAAVFVLIVGITFVAINFSNSPEISANKEAAKPESSKLAQKANSVQEPIDQDQTRDENVVQPKPEMVRETLPKAIDTNNSPIVRVKTVANNRSKKVENKNNSTNKPSDHAFANRNDRLKHDQKPGEIPKLTNFDTDDDDSLRLVDLFDEVGSK